MLIGAWFRQQRIAKKISLDEIEKITGISRSTISRFERGETGAKWETIVKFASAIDISPSVLTEAAEIDWMDGYDSDTDVSEQELKKLDEETDKYLMFLLWKLIKSNKHRYTPKKRGGNKNE